MYLERIFGKNIAQTMRQLQFKFDPLPTELAEICLFHERCIKTLDTQPFDQLYIKYGLILYKNYLVQFRNKYTIGPSQKNSFWALQKWLKIDRKIRNTYKLVLIHKMWSNLSENLCDALLQNSFDSYFTKSFCF